MELKWIDVVAMVKVMMKLRMIIMVWFIIVFVVVYSTGCYGWFRFLCSSSKAVIILGILECWFDRMFVELVWANVMLVVIMMIKLTMVIMVGSVFNVRIFMVVG